MCRGLRRVGHLPLHPSAIQDDLHRPCRAVLVGQGHRADPLTSPEGSGLLAVARMAASPVSLNRSQNRRNNRRGAHRSIDVPSATQRSMEVGLPTARPAVRLPGAPNDRRGAVGSCSARESEQQHEESRTDRECSYQRGRSLSPATGLVLRTSEEPKRASGDERGAYRAEDYPDLRELRGSRDEHESTPRVHHTLLAGKAVRNPHLIPGSTWVGVLRRTSLRRGRLAVRRGLRVRPVPWCDAGAVSTVERRPLRRFVPHDSSHQMIRLQKGRERTSPIQMPLIPPSRPG